MRNQKTLIGVIVAVGALAGCAAGAPDGNRPEPVDPSAAPSRIGPYVQAMEALLDGHPKPDPTQAIAAGRRVCTDYAAHRARDQSVTTNVYVYMLTADQPRTHDYALKLVQASIATFCPQFRDF